MYLIGAIRSRSEFGPFLRRMGMTGHAVEVGTHRGAFAIELLGQWPGFLNCVDPWSVPPGYESQASGLADSDGDREKDYEACRAAMKPFAARVMLHRCLSCEAAERFDARSLDFVYLDGDHSEAMVAADLSAWWPKVAPGGLLAGHDAVCLPGPDNWGGQIQPVLSRFASLVGLDVNLVVEDGREPMSWYIVRPP